MDKALKNEIMTVDQYGKKSLDMFGGKEKALELIKEI
jgi:hypothetical protein